MAEWTKEVTTRIDKEEREGTTISTEKRKKTFKRTEGEGGVGLVGMRYSSLVVVQYRSMQVRSGTGDPRPRHDMVSSPTISLIPVQLN